MRTNASILYLGCLLLKFWLIFLQVLKVFDKPFGKSNTERQVKIIKKVTKSQNLVTRG